MEYRHGIAYRSQIDTLNLEQSSQYFADGKCIIWDETTCIFIRISCVVLPKGPIDNMSALTQVIAWRWTGDRPLYLSQWWTSSMTFIYATRSQCVKTCHNFTDTYRLLVASLMSLMASLLTTSPMQQCFNVLIDICHEFLLLFHYLPKFTFWQVCWFNGLLLAKIYILASMLV